MITKEVILQRIAMLEADKAKLLSSLNATEGALLDCDFWLTQLENPKETKE